MVVNNTTPAVLSESVRRTESERVTIVVPARLHLGFLDLNGDLGRRYGSFGITLDDICTRLHVERADTFSGSGPSADRAVRFVRELLHQLNRSDSLVVSVEEAIPEHVGLGSGTQLAMAAGVGAAKLLDLDLSARDIAGYLVRGKRSGVGIGSFEMGGVILDGGRGDSGTIPPVLARYEFPAKWRILLIFDRRIKGKHGAEEETLFLDLPPFPAELSAHFCRLLLMVGLPALAEADLDGFSRAVAEIQRATGDFFAPVQGNRFASESVAAVLEWLQARGIVGVGQSSWGPTGFALIGSDSQAKRLVSALIRNFADVDHLDFKICRGRNTGSQIDVIERIESQKERRGLFHRV
jgi:beta-ribofuranosylaminobenzene 5'-phosphate synthase